MAITNLDGYIAAAKQNIQIAKTASVTAVALMNTQVLQAAGSPGGGVLAGASTAAGIVPTDATPGFPLVNAFGVGAEGYLSKVEFGASVPCRLSLYDCLFKAGAFAFNANVTLAAQPSFSSRVLGGTDFNNTEIWIEAVTAFTGSQSIVVTYTNQAGVTAKTTGVVATGVAPIVGRMLQLPFAAGDTGVQKIESVTSSVSTAGTFNVLVLRRLWGGYVPIANGGDVHDFLKTGLIKIFGNSAFMLISRPTSTATGIINVAFQVANG